MAEKLVTNFCPQCEARERAFAEVKQRTKKAETALRMITMRMMLEELAGALGLRDECCELCGIGPGSERTEHADTCLGPRLLKLLELLEAEDAENGHLWTVLKLLEVLELLEATEPQGQDQ